MNERETLQSWIFCPKPNPSAQVRLVCLPYAGGGAAAYREWPEFLGDQIEVCALQLPGREGRLREPAFRRMRQAVEATAAVLDLYQDLPVALFGHSMGAVICFELARLWRSQQQAPVHLFVSGRRAPQFPDRRPQLTPLSDERFVEEIRRRYNGIPREVLQEPELLQMLLPTLRADVEMLETYDYQPAAPFQFPITAFGGEDDHETSIDQLNGWREQTSARFEMNVVSGDHFFLRCNARQVLTTIRRQLDSVIACF